MLVGFEPTTRRFVVPRANICSMGLLYIAFIVDFVKVVVIVDLLLFFVSVLVATYFSVLLLLLFLLMLLINCGLFIKDRC